MKKNPGCPMCGGCGVPLGSLGNLTWFRCQDCGMEFSRTAKTRKPKKGKRARYQDEIQESAMQAGMAFGIDAYNEVQGWS